MLTVRIALAVAFLTSIAAAAAAQPASCTVSEADVVCTEQGSVRGVPEGATLAFKGIPYAKPPIGMLRWKPPEAPEQWDGIRDGSLLGAMCPQLAGKDVKGEEDCLYLNIWRPREKPDRPLPVMVWLTGGGNHALSGQGMQFFGGVVYSGERLTVLPRVYGPNVDGHVFPDQPIKLITNRQYPPMPVIIGNTTGETRSWADSAGAIIDEGSYAAAIDKLFGAPARDRILAVYPATAYPTPREAFAQLTTGSEFTCQSRRVARALFQAQKEPVYRYLFNYALENDPELKALGPTHTVEHPFFFAWQGKYRPSDNDRAVQRSVVGYWTRMVTTGNPNGDSDPEWPAYSPENDAYLEIGVTAAAKAGPASAHCDFWDTVPLLWPHV
jgi:carboxylesterase type B